MAAAMCICLRVDEIKVFPGTVARMKVGSDRAYAVEGSMIAGVKELIIANHDATRPQTDIEVGVLCAITEYKDLGKDGIVIQLQGLGAVIITPALVKEGIEMVTYEPVVEFVEPKDMEITAVTAAKRALIAAAESTGVLADAEDDINRIDNALDMKWTMITRVDWDPGELNLYMGEADLLRALEWMSANLMVLMGDIEKLELEEPGMESRNKDVNKIRERMEGRELPEYALKTLEEELTRLERTRPDASEYSTILDYVDWILAIPWGKLVESEIDMDVAEKILEEDHYGLKDVKERVLDHIAVKKLKEDSKTPILCLYGPPGTGKTSVVKSLARAMGRNYVRLSLGGVHHESEIRGHRRTFVGAMPGRIVKAMKEAKCMNPVICLDEVDKLKDGGHNGDPSAALLEVLDPEQNFSFNDTYMDMPIDLSKVMFVATANYLDQVPDPVRDRLELIEVTGYTHADKLEIAKGWLIPRNLKDHGLPKTKGKFPKKSLDLIISEFTNEAGVRHLNQRIAMMTRKAVRIIAAGKKKSVTITEKMVRDALGKTMYRENKLEKDTIGMVAGLCVSGAGGDLLFVQAKRVTGKGKFELTGLAGETMKESSRIVRTVVRGLCPDWKYEADDVHVHFPDGSTYKDGPSAGVTMTTALYSAVTGKPVPRHICMTGEVDICGRVLPIGGLAHKLRAAFIRGMKKAIIPVANYKRDLDEIAEEVKAGLEIKAVSSVDELIKEVF